MITFSVLPSLEVKLMPMDSFFYVDSQELSITIKAEYVKVLVLCLTKDQGPVSESRFSEN